MGGEDLFRFVPMGVQDRRHCRGIDHVLGGASGIQDD